MRLRGTKAWMVLAPEMGHSTDRSPVWRQTGGAPGLHSTRGRGKGKGVREQSSDARKGSRLPTSQHSGSSRQLSWAPDGWRRPWDG